MVEETDSSVGNELLKSSMQESLKLTVIKITVTTFFFSKRKRRKALWELTVSVMASFKIPGNYIYYTIYKKA